MAAFWAGVTGGTPATAGEVVFLPPAGPDGFAMFCQPLERPLPDRLPVHLDLTVQ
ncbi:hypothetical protein [Nocardioides psychrotolerans]|nr:hypothetical protein [Nocardioides psychrotolerans]